MKLDTYALKVFLGVHFLLGSVAFAQLPSDQGVCTSCSANSKSAQNLFDGVANVAGPPIDQLPESEKKKLKKEKEEFIQTKLVPQQAEAYRLEFGNYKACLKKYQAIFGDEVTSEDAGKGLKTAEAFDQQVEIYKNKFSSNQVARRFPDCSTSNNAPFCQIKKSCLNPSWATDSGLRVEFDQLYSKIQSDSDKSSEYFLKRAEKAYQDPARAKRVDEYLNRTYLDARDQLLARKNENLIKHNKPQISDLSEEDIKNLKVSFSLPPKDTDLVFPTSDGYKNLTLDGVANRVRTQLQSDGADPAIDCYPGRKKADLDAWIKEHSLSSTDPVEPVSPMVPDVSESFVNLPAGPFTELCNLDQTFLDDKVEVSENSKKTIEGCLNNARKKCPGGNVKVKAQVQSCASTLVSKAFKSNAEIAAGRAKSMGDAFLNTTKALGIQAELGNYENDPERARYENLKDGAGLALSDRFTGTCGPKPPAGYSTEPWMKNAFCEKERKPASGQFYTDEAGIPANETWKYPPEPGLKGKTIPDYYKSFRKASLNVTYTCTGIAPETGSSQDQIEPYNFVPEKPVMETTACGVFVKCVRPSATLTISNPSSGGSGSYSGGSGWKNFWSGLGGNGTTKGGRGSASCPRFN